MTLLLATGLVGALTLPVWVYAAGRRLALRRAIMEAPHRFPRPPVDVASPLVAPAPAADARRAFVDGRAAAAGDSPRSADEVQAVLRTRHGMHVRVRENGRGAWHVVVVDEPPRVGGAACEYDRGLLAGLFGPVADGPAEVRELSCRAAGHPECVFDVQSARADVAAAAHRPALGLDEASGGAGRRGRARVNDRARTG